MSGLGSSGAAGGVVTPTVIQFDGRECGPAALAMILAYHGRPVPLEELAARCDVERLGSRADRLLLAARHYGLGARGLRLQAARARALQPPFIAHWQGDHFIVVEACAPDQVTINDPACGRRVWSVRDFDEGFSGVALLFAPANLGARESPPARLVSDRDPVVAALQAGVRGAVGWLPEQLARYSEDFSRATRQRPRVVVKAVCEQDICHTLEVAREAGLAVVTRGAGHSRRGQSLTRAGIVLVNHLDTPVAQYRMLGEDEVEVTARTRWDALEAELARLGRMVPVVPAYGGLSVGGTLSVGGYGERSIAHGSQVRHVRRVRLVTPSGVALWCSPEEEGELFRYALAGLGQVGVIERVVLGTTALEPLAEPQYLQYPSRDAFLDALAHFVALPAQQAPHLAAYVLKDAGFVIETRTPAGEPAPSPPGGRPTAARPDFRGQNTADAGMRLAADYVLDLVGLTAFLAVLEDLWRATTLGAYAGWALVLAVRQYRGGIVFPLEATPASTPDVAFLVGFYPSVPPGDEQGLASVSEILRQTLTACRELGGRPYLYGSHELDEAAWPAFYGDGYRRLQALCRELDPQGLLNRHRP